MEFIYHKCIKVPTDTYDIEIYKWKGLNVWHLLLNYETTTIKYCPYCGEKL